jgi:hypothetical protein
LESRSGLGDNTLPNYFKPKTQNLKPKNCLVQDLGYSYHVDCAIVFLNFMLHIGMWGVWGIIPSRYFALKKSKQVIERPKPDAEN